VKAAEEHFHALESFFAFIVAAGSDIVSVLIKTLENEAAGTLQEAVLARLDIARPQVEVLRAHDAFSIHNARRRNAANDHDHKSVNLQFPFGNRVSVRSTRQS
jgi:hypothetical protein